MATRTTYPVATLTTTDATPTELWNSGAAEVAAYSVVVSAHETGIARAGAIAWQGVIVTRDTSEGSWLIASNLINADIGTPGYTVSATLNGSNFASLTVTGVASETVNWKAWVEKIA